MKCNLKAKQFLDLYMGTIPDVFINIVMTQDWFPYETLNFFQ